MGNIIRKRRNKRTELYPLYPQEEIMEQLNQIQEMQEVQEKQLEIIKVMVERNNEPLQNTQQLDNEELPKEEPKKYINPTTEIINKSLQLSKAGRPKKFPTKEEIEQKEKEDKLKKQEASKKVFNK